MRKLILITVILGVIFSCSSFFCFAEGNLLKNPSFEDVSGSIPAGWETWMYTPGSTMAVLSGQGRTGDKCILITSNTANDARLKQTVPVKENTTYKLSCWAKTENVGSQKTGAIISYEGDAYSSKDLKGTNDKWQNLEMYVKVGSGVGSINVTVGLGGYSNINTGKAYFDDVSVEEVSKVPDGVTVANIAKKQSAANESSSGGNDKSSGSGSLVIMLLIGAVVIIGGIAYFIFARRKTKGNTSENEDDLEYEEDEDDEESDQDDDSYTEDN